MHKIINLEIHKEEFSFAAGHFTIFSATEREQLHGHNYNVSVAFEVKVMHNGLSFDYRHYKKKINLLCAQLNGHFLLPAQSPYLRIEDAGDYWNAYFDNKKIPFLKEDALILPIANATIEELSHWFLQEILASAPEMDAHHIQKLTVRVFNGPGQSGGACWTNTAG